LSFIKYIPLPFKNAVLFAQSDEKPEAGSTIEFPNYSILNLIGVRRNSQSEIAKKVWELNGDPSLRFDACSETISKPSPLTNIYAYALNLVFRKIAHRTRH
jgi:hypothetical protein